MEKLKSQNDSYKTKNNVCVLNSRSTHKPTNSPEMAAIKEKTSLLDVSTHAGLAKMLIQHQDKMAYKDLQEAMTHTKTGHQTRQMKEAAFRSQVRENVEMESENRRRWQIHLGEDLISKEQKMNILKEQESAAAEYKTKKDLGGREIDLTGTLPKLSSHRVQRNVGQLPGCSPVFADDGNRQLEIRQRALRMFQQAVRKVVLRCRANQRLGVLKKLKVEKHLEDEKLPVRKLSPEMLLPFKLPIFIPSDDHDELGVNGIQHMRPLNMDLTPNIPFFNLKVPQQFRLMGYRQLTVYEARASFVNTELCRPLRVGAEDELLPTMTSFALEFDLEKELQNSEQDISSTLTFSAPQNLLISPNAHPLRIFNPAPSVYAFKPRPLYLENDLDFHLCPLPRHALSKGITAPRTQKRFLDRKDIIKGTTSSYWVPQLSDPFTSLLPMEAPPADDTNEEFLSGVTEGTSVSLTPEMVQAVFASSENAFSSQLEEKYTHDKDTFKLPKESSVNSQNSCLVSKVMARMKYFKMLRQSSQTTKNCSVNDKLFQK